MTSAEFLQAGEIGRFKFINSKNILKNTIANGTKQYIARQTEAMMVHAKSLMISGARYLLANAFTTWMEILQIDYKLRR